MGSVALSGAAEDLLPTLHSLIAGRWFGTQPAQTLASAVNGRPVAATHAEAIDFAEAVAPRAPPRRARRCWRWTSSSARRGCGAGEVPAERKEPLYAVGAHRRHARRQLDRHRRRHRHAVRLRRGGQQRAALGQPAARRARWCRWARRAALPARTSWCRARAGGAHQRLQLPGLGLLEKFAPSFLAGMPCIAKPATATSYLTEACVQLMMESGLLPEGALQLVIGGTGDLLDRLDGQDVVTFTGSADTAARLRVHPNLVRLGALQRRGRLAELRHPGARRESRRRGVRALRQGGGARDDGQGRPEVHRDPPRHRAAPAPRRGGERLRARLAKDGGRRPGAGRRAHGRAGLARAARRRERARGAAAARAADRVRRAGRLHAAGRGRGRGRLLLRPRCCCARTRSTPRRCTTSKPSAR
jgi:hypothetical protein